MVSNAGHGMHACFPVNIVRRKVQSMQQRLKELQVKRDSGKGDLLHVQREYESVDKSLHGLLNGDMPASLAILNQQGSGKKASKPTMKRTLDVAQESDDAAASVAADEAATLELLLAIEQTVVAAEQQQQQQMMLENGPLAKKPRLTL